MVAADTPSFSQLVTEVSLYQLHDENHFQENGKTHNSKILFRELRRGVVFENYLHLS
jgi:hypothetical protein